MTNMNELFNWRREKRAVSPVIGVVLMIIITVLLASVVASMVLSFSSESPAPHAAVDVAVDLDEDSIKIIHTDGDTLYSDKTRIVWTIGGTHFVSQPPDRTSQLSAGQEFTTYFDGSSVSTGQWGTSKSPGTTDITGSDTIKLKLYDIKSNKPVFETSFRAGEKSEDFDSTGSGSGGLVSLSNQSPEKSDVNFNVEFTIQLDSETIGNSLNSVEIEMGDSSLTLFSGTSWSNINTAGVDTDGDGTIDIDLTSDTDDWIVKNGGSHVKIEFGGAAYTTVESGDTIIINFDGITTPSSGTYSSTVQTSGDGNYQTGTITIN